jgi:signal transduction histidine kinase
LNDEQAGGTLEPAAIVLLNDVIDQAVVRAVAQYHRARVRTLEALERIAQEGLRAEPQALEALLHRLLQVIIDTVESVDTAVLYLREWDRLVIRAAVGLERDVEGRFSLAMGEGFAGTIATSMRPLLIHSVESDPRVLNPVLRMERVKALYGVPLIHGNEVIGVAKMGSRTVSNFATDDRQILRGAADRAAAFIAQRRETDYRELLLHVLGHDLRSPLNTVALGGAALRKGESLSPASERTLERILSASRRMDRLIGDLTDYTRTRSTGRLPLNRERLDMCEVVAEAAREIQGTAGRDLHVDCTGDVVGQWDRGRLLRVLVNLVNNAVAYGAAAPVTVRVQGDESLVHVHVHNEGAAIPEDLKPRLFEAFKRGTTGEGAGLGLYIVEQVVQAHGGQIAVESSPEKGTTFSMHLPRSAA